MPGLEEGGEQHAQQISRDNTDSVTNDTKNSRESTSISSEKIGRDFKNLYKIVRFSIILLWPVNYSAKNFCIHTAVSSNVNRKKFKNLLYKKIIKLFINRYKLTSLC